MQIFDAKQVMGLYGMVIPLSILLIEDDQERELLIQAYVQYKSLMYKTAISFFKGDPDAVDEAVSDSTERLCRYYRKFLSISYSKRAAYIVRLVENVCRTQLRIMMLQKDKCVFSLDDEEYKHTPESDVGQETIFSKFFADELLESFDKLSTRDRELLRMRHVDRMSYSEMAESLRMSEEAVRTALTRAKKRLQKQELK